MSYGVHSFFFFFFKQKTAYEMRISDWSSDVCSSDLSLENPFAYEHSNLKGHLSVLEAARHAGIIEHLVYASSSSVYGDRPIGGAGFREDEPCTAPVSLYAATKRRSEEHTSELQSLMRISYAVFCLKKNNAI